ncbi:MAG TPA: hypothetical protein VHE61_17775 [Opitutaceae bacterium]|nr:hypothetical protein [Opitutaceae bacterium]
MNEIAADKKDLDRMRMDLEQARVRADAEADAARTALAQLDVQRRELEAMRTELLRARTEMEQFQANQSQNAEALESSLREARKQQTQLEEELQRVRSHSVSPRTLDARLAQLGHMEAKLHATERELADTRQALEEERGRRDRAIALIKPKPVEAAQRAGTSPKP